MTVTSKQYWNEFDSDKVLNSLLQDESISKYRKLSEKAGIGGRKFVDMTTEQYQYIRKRAKLDLFFLCTAICNYDRLSINLHGDLCNWMVRNQQHRFKEVLLPRGHFKSTIETIAHPIQIALPGNYLPTWPECLGPNVRILIAHETLEMSSKFLVSITAHFLSNPVLMGLFPECIPIRTKQKINQSELELPHSEIWNEPTFLAKGVGAKAQGIHCNYLKLDDLIGDKARDSKIEMLAAKDWFDGVKSFFSTFAKDKLDLIGTRYGFEDLYAHANKAYGSQLLKYVRGVEEPDANGIKQPIFPEEYTTELLDTMRVNPKIWVQYSNDPAELTDGLQESWLNYYEWKGYNEIFLRGSEENDDENIDVMSLDRVILVDPGMSKSCGVVITGSDLYDRIFTLEAFEEQWLPNQFSNWLFKAVARWQPRLVAIESVLFSALFKNFLESEMVIRGQPFHVEAIPVGQKHKEDRVKALSQQAALGQFYFHKSQETILRQWKQFGSIEEYHCLDAFSLGPKVWNRPIHAIRGLKQPDIHVVNYSDRDPVTGY